MKEQLARLIREYASVPAPPGHEQELGRQIAAEWEAHGEVHSDRLGNVWQTFGSGDSHVVILAHLDEVALVVRKIDADGFLRVHRVGGIPERVLMAQGAIVLGRGGPVEGVFGTVAHHLATDAQKTHVVTADEQYLDVGAASREDAMNRLGLAVGDFVVYRRTWRQHGELLYSNSMDDRAGLAVLSTLAQRLAGQELSRRVSVLASVQEEFSLRGLLPAVRSLEPDAIICVDIAPACDTPELKHRADVGLGKGVAISHYSFHGRGTLAGVIPPRWFTDAAVALAEEAGIAFQRTTLFGGLTDASFGQLEGAGATAIDLGIPTRYTHAPIEVCHLDDLVATCQLAELLATRASLNAPST